MRLSKFLLLVTFSTFFALLYVHQQSEIFRLAYIGQKKTAEFQELLDKNTILRYNIESDASLIRIGNKLSYGRDYEMPASFQLVKLRESLEGSELPKLIPRRQNLIARFFSIKREAQAKTISP